MGVVNPERDENNYRIFDSRSLINLVLCKKCNEYGFSYKESIDLLTKNNFVENTELLKKRSKKIAMFKALVDGGIDSIVI